MGFAPAGTKRISVTKPAGASHKGTDMTNKCSNCKQTKSHTVRCADGSTKTFPVYKSRTLAIKLMCTECLGWSGNPKDCTDRKCPLFPFRGKTLAAYSSKETDEDMEAGND